MGKIILSEPLRVAKDDFIILINELCPILERHSNETIDSNLDFNFSDFNQSDFCL